MSYGLKKKFQHIFDDDYRRPLFRFRLLGIILFIVASTLRGECAGISISELLENSTTELVEKAGDYLIKRDAPDSALLCYTLIADRYAPDMSDSEKIVIAKALHNMGILSYEYFYDYASALDALNRAYKISSQTGDDRLSGLLLERLGNVYILCSQLTDSKDLGARPSELFFQSYMLARKSGDVNSVCRNIVNMTSLSVGDNKNTTAKLSVALADFDRLLSADSVPDRWIYTRVSAAGNHILKDKYSDALEEFRLLYEDLQSKNPGPELMPQVIENIIDCCMKLGQYEKGLCYTDSLIELSKANSYLYDEAMAFRLRGELYSLIGEQEKAKSDSLRYYQLRDSLMENNQVKLIQRYESVANMREENRELIYERHKHEKQKLFFNMLVVLLVAVVIFSAILYHRHRQLKDSYLQLYRNMQEELKREDSDRLERNSQQTARPLREQVSQSLSDQQNDEYRARILRVMDNDEAIYSADFSLNRLAEITDIKPRTLSVALNEIFSKNFYELLNEYRVREACRRLSNREQYGHLTIEAISQSVGYKSRTSLVNAFKKTTGLTPSEYQKLAVSQTK